MIERILFFLFTLAVGLGIIVYTLPWVNTVGKNQWAEEKLGAGGTYILWKGIGVLIIIFGFLILIGQVALSPSPSSETEQNNELFDNLQQ